MKYTYIDGDNIGLRIEQSFLKNDETELWTINSKVINAINNISSYLKTNEQTIIFAGADGIISKGEKIDVNKLLEMVRDTDTDLTFSIGIGNTLKSCYVALRYAKSYGKNIAIDYSDELNYKVIGK